MKSDKNSMQPTRQHNKQPEKMRKGPHKVQQQLQQKYEKQDSFQSGSSQQQQSPQMLEHQQQATQKHSDEQQWQQLQGDQAIYNNPWIQIKSKSPKQDYKFVAEEAEQKNYSKYQQQKIRRTKASIIKKKKQAAIKIQNNQSDQRKLKKNAKQHKTNIEFKERLNIIILVLMLFIAAIVVAHYFLRNDSNIQQSQSSKKPVKNNQNIKKQILQQTEDRQKPQKVTSNLVQQQPIPLIPPKDINREQQKQNLIPLPPTTNQPQIPTYNSQDSINRQKYSSTLNLKDLESDPVYMNAPPQIKQIFDEMMQRPPNKKTKPSSIFVPSQKAYFAYRLYQNPQNQRYLKAEYYYYDQKYKIGSYPDELPLCVIAPGRNIVKGDKYKRFIDSIQNQNYSNYILVYLDDNSDDNSSKQFQNYVKLTNGPLNKYKAKDLQFQGSFIVTPQNTHPKNQAKLIIVQNKQRLYALANRNQGVRNFCPHQSIVLDVDSDDAIIGKQAFKFVNAIYHDPQVWMFNSVFIYESFYNQDQVTTGPQDGVPYEILVNNQYRTSMIWKTSQLRTFKAQLFKKIDEKDFRDDNGVFYQWASDVFIQQPLVELAGPKHYKHLFEIVYYYDWQFDKTTVFKRRHYRDIVFMQTPYQPLQNLQSPAKKVQNYFVPQRIRDEYEKNIKQARKEAARYGRQAPF